MSHSEGDLIRMAWAEPSNVERVIEGFGGLTALARALGHKHVSTVQGWKERGVIPARQQPRVFAAAQKAALNFTPADLMAIPR